MTPEPIEVRVTWMPVISARQGGRAFPVEETPVRPLYVTMKVAPITTQSAIDATATYTAEDMAAWIVSEYDHDLAGAIAVAKRAALR